MANNLVVCGGTFDHFHKGHAEFLKYTLSLGGKVTVGLTSDEYFRNSKLKSQNANLRESYEIRKKSLEKFLMQKKAQDRASVSKINDLFGPTLSKDLVIDAIVVSKDTKKGAEAINQARRRLGLSPIKIFIAPSVKAEDEKLISSARIRNGEINRQGRLYVKDLWFKKGLKLTQNLRREFKKPFGELFKDIKDSSISKNSLMITVGDITTKIFNEKSLRQKLSVIDFKVARKKKFFNILELGFVGNEKIFQVENPAGNITSNLFAKLSEIFKSDVKEKIILQINGEDDLVVLSLVLFSPLNTIIYYGQPGQGIVKIEVSEETKKNAYELANRLQIVK